MGHNNPKSEFVRNNELFGAICRFRTSGQNPLKEIRYLERFYPNKTVNFPLRWFLQTQCAHDPS